MKDWIEHICPLFNRINPAALISDSLYALNMYPSLTRFALQYGHTGCHDTGAVLYFRSDIKEV